MLAGQVNQFAVGHFVGLVRQRQENATTERRLGVADRRLAFMVTSGENGIGAE